MITLDRSDVPFKHAATTNAIAPEAADALRTAVATFDDWKPASADFYRNSLRHFTEDDVPTQLTGLVTTELTRQVREGVECAFDVSLAPGALMMLNRFEAGEGTLVHNDYIEDVNHRYFFTHRALLYLNNAWDPSMGGVLGIFDAPYASTPVATIEPHHNSMSAMAMGPVSYHAVSAQRGPARYSVVWSFRTADGRHQR